MSSASTITVESHSTAATLYARGDLTTMLVLHLTARLERLPESVRALCVDLRGTSRTAAYALTALEFALSRWRAARRGTTYVKLPPDVFPNSSRATETRAHALSGPSSDGRDTFVA